MNSYDFVIVGGGMVGLSAALGCAQLGYKVAVVNAGARPEYSDGVSNRVSALNLASQKWLQQLGVWQKLVETRATPFNQMQIWQSGEGGEVRLNGNDLGATELGHIVENSITCYALSQLVEQQEEVSLFYQAPAKQLSLGEREAWLILQDGTMLGAQQIIAADGGHSWCRQQANLPVTFRDYGHHALVATVKTELPHQNCARQAFTPQGPLAFLPLHEEHLCSIVWSTPPELAHEYQSLEQQLFERKLTAAFDSELGLCSLQGEVKRIPLTMRYAREWLKPRLILMGDAAHTIHPLAGQGVNLGFADAEEFVSQLTWLKKSGVTDLGDAKHWRSYERSRKAAAVEMIAAMDAIKLAFAAKPSPIKSLIGMGMALVNRTDLVKNLLMKRAMGLD